MNRGAFFTLMRKPAGVEWLRDWPQPQAQRRVQAFLPVIPDQLIARGDRLPAIHLDDTVSKAATNPISAVIDAPTDISLSGSTVAENAPINTVIGAFSTTDPDPTSTFTYSLVSGAGSDDNASFAIMGSVLHTSVTFNIATKSSYSIRVRSTDQGGLWFEKQFTITIIPGDVVIPTVSWVSPVGDGKVYILNGRYVSLLVTAADNTSITQVKFFRWDKVRMAFVDIGFVFTAPYAWNLDTTILSDYWNEIDVESYDTAGNISEYSHIFLLRQGKFYLPFVAKS